MRQNLQFVLPVLLLLAACGSGSGGGAATSTAASEPGSVTVLLDTRAGSDSWVQFQLAGATLEGPGGLQTDNLLREARILTVADPSGEVTGLRLRVAPTANYEALHLVFVPGTGVGRDAAGDSFTVTGPIDVRVPIMDGLQHDATTASWLVIGYDNAALTIQGTNATWSPEMSGRPDGTEVTLDPLAYPVVRGRELTVTATMADDSVLTIRESMQSGYRNEEGIAYPTREAFLDELTLDDDVCVLGRITRKGHLDADTICRKPRYAQSRFIGRVLEIGANGDRFRFRVQAVNPRGAGPLLEAPVEVWIVTSGARIEASNGNSLAFAELAVGRLVKVKWRSFEVGPGGMLIYSATSVEVPGGDSARPHPQWQARVTSVDVANHSFVIEPRNGKPIRIGGESVTQATVLVGANTKIERRAPGGRQMISLSQIQPAIDRVWIRGRATGPATIEASRVRVREE
ncbi:MAG: hypothetical protein ACI89X_002366 [Planctomycetota bacterium]|jgi:hypothetical protein